ncbi:MAG: hypothetical protein M5U19_23070 [Microthrixaceae bacterium]|nr:hypothetical protein [Microthrixaceae bacterium]
MKVPSPIVLATANQAKAAELAEALAAPRRVTSGLVGSGDEAITVLTRPPEVPEIDETADDFEGNARLKAAAVSEVTGCAAVADDSGARGGPPRRGSRCALGSLRRRRCGRRGQPREAPRRAQEPSRGRPRPPCTLPLRGGADRPGFGDRDRPRERRGSNRRCARGSHGFGYDPVFVPDDGDGRTFAEMSSTEKLAISHRGRALRDLVAGIERA